MIAMNGEKAQYYPCSSFSKTFGGEVIHEKWASKVRPQMNKVYAVSTLDKPLAVLFT